MDLRTIGVLVAFSAFAPAVHAEDAATEARDAEARGLFAAGEAAFNDGRFGDAEQYFRRSYELSQRHVLLYNIALAADQARHDEAALAAYEEFLARVPESDRTTRVRRRIEELRAIVARGAPAAESEPELAASGHAGIDPAPWIVVGGSAAVAIAGGVLIGLAAADVGAVENAPMNSRWSEVEAAYDRSEPLSIAGFVMLGVGVAAVGAGIVWALTSSGSREQASLRIGPGNVAVRGSF